jgi:hypothetical protein
MDRLLKRVDGRRETGQRWGKSRRRASSPYNGIDRLQNVTISEYFVTSIESEKSRGPPNQ